jgi:hypothetical protein
VTDGIDIATCRSLLTFSSIYTHLKLLQRNTDTISLSLSLSIYIYIYIPAIGREMGMMRGLTNKWCVKRMRKVGRRQCSGDL